MVVGVIVIGSLLGFQFFARPAYKRHKETRSIEQAKNFMAKRDYRNASLSARQTLQVNPSNLEACRIMADLAERSPFPAALLDWRRRIADLAPRYQHERQQAEPQQADQVKRLDEVTPGRNMRPTGRQRLPWPRAPPMSRLHPSRAPPLHRVWG